MGELIFTEQARKRRIPLEGEDIRKHVSREESQSSFSISILGLGAEQASNVAAVHEDDEEHISPADMVAEPHEAHTEKRGFWHVLWRRIRGSAKWTQEEYEDLCFISVEAWSHARWYEKAALVVSVSLAGVTFIPLGKVAVVLGLVSFSPELATLYGLFGEPILIILAAVITLLAPFCFRKYVWKKVFQGIAAAARGIARFGKWLLTGGDGKKEKTAGSRLAVD